MGAENGRGFVGDRERFTAQERRDLNRLDERAEAARKKVADCEAALKRFEVHLGEAFLEKKDPPRAAVDLQRQLTEARNTVAACAAVQPEKVRALEAREAEWLEKRAPEMEARVREVVEDEAAAARALAEKQAVRAAAFADIKHASPRFPLPELPVLLPKLDQLLGGIATWPPKPALAPAGQVRVRLLPDARLQHLDPLHRLYKASAAALDRIGRYNPADTFGLSPQDAEVLVQIGRVERVADQPHEPGVTP